MELNLQLFGGRGGKSGGGGGGGAAKNFSDTSLTEAENSANAKEYFSQEYSKWDDNLTAHEHELISKYTNGFGISFMQDSPGTKFNTEQSNIQLRLAQGDLSKVDPKVADLVSTVNGAIDKFELKDKLITYRGMQVSGDGSFYKNITTMKKGDTFTEHGIMSTSTSFSVARILTNGSTTEALTPTNPKKVIMRVTNNPGKGKGAWIQPKSHKYGWENEFTKKAGTTFKFIRSHTSSDGTLIVDIED